MPVPEFFHFLKPSLEIVSRNPGIYWKEVAEHCSEVLGLTLQDREEVINSGQTKWENRAQWALTYLRQAKLIEKAGRGKSTVTPRGLEFLKTAPSTIKPADLNQFPEFAEFAKGGKSGSVQGTPQESPEQLLTVTPQEAMANAHVRIRAELIDSLLERLKKVSPSRFERIIVELMLRLGYGGPRDDAGEALGKSGDGGIDGIIRQDMLGLDNIYLQAKRYSETAVGTSEVNSFIGALTTRGANKGVLITTSNFSDSARRVATSAPHLKLSLIDGRELAKLMIDHELGVSLEVRYDIKRIDSDYFSEELD